MEGALTTVTLLTLITLIQKVIDFVKFASTGRHWREVATQIIVWAVAVAVIWMATAANITAAFVIAGTKLGDMNAGSIILLGLSYGSGASFLNDYRNARDNTASAAMPKLGGS